jgi:hypothetical protein
MDMSPIHVHIDRIVLRGVDPADRDALVSGLKSELARVLAHPEAAASYAVTRRTPVMRLGQIAMEPGLGGARKFGNSVARAIGKGMAR